MKTSYHDAKFNNGKTGNEPNFPSFYEDFESILGCTDTVKISKMGEIICKEAPQQLSLKRKHNDDENVGDLLEFFMQIY